MFSNLRNEKIMLAILILSVLTYILFFSSLAILRYRSFFSYEWEDLAESNSMCWHVTHGTMSDIFMGSVGGKYQTFHVIPFAILLCYLYIFFPCIYTLFLITTFFLAIAAIPLYLINLEILKSRLAAIFLATAYLLYAPKHSLNFLDGDSSIFIIPFLFFVFYFALKEKLRLVIMFSILTILCKTESSLFIILLFLYLYIKRKNFKRINSKIIGILLAVFSIYFFIAVYIFNAFSTDGLFRYFYAPSLPLTMRYAIKHLFSFLSVAHKKALYHIAAPLLFLPLFSLESYIGLPSLMQVIFTKYFVFQRAYYIAGMIPFLFIGTVYSIKKIGDKFYSMLMNFEKRWLIFERRHIYSTLAMIVFASCFFSNFGDNIIGSSYPKECGEIQDKRFQSTKNIYDKRFYVMDEEDYVAWELIGKIPIDASVSASGDLLPQLSYRKKLRQFLDDHYNYYDVEYILVHNRNMYMGAGHYCWDDGKMQKELNFLLSSEQWSLLEKKGDFFLFKKNT